MKKATYKRLAIYLSGSVLIVGTVLVMWGWLIGSTGFEGMERDHFDGTRFYNIPQRPHHGFGGLLKWQFKREPGEWQRVESDAFRPAAAPPKSVSGDTARVTFVNHSTVLIQLDGLNILTDPIWAERAGPVSFAGPKRMHPPGIRFEDLPPIDAVLISHNHYDHLCIPTLKRLNERDKPQFITGLGNGETLARAKIAQVHELDWWQSDALGRNVRVTFVPAQHFSGRGLFDHFKTLWGGFMIEGSSKRVLFAGDTGAGPHFDDIRVRLGAPDLALLPIGAYRPRWFMGPVHLSPSDAVEAHRQLQAGLSMGIHFGTFRLADDGQHEAPRELAKAVKAAGLNPKAFLVPKFGESLDL